MSDLLRFRKAVLPGFFRTGIVEATGQGLDTSNPCLFLV